MAEYTVDNIRNVHLVSESGSGKTSLAEAILYSTGETTRLGRIDEGNTISDFTDIEKERNNSVSLSLMHTEWNGNKINLLDSPGYMDFVGEVYAGNAAVEGNIILVSAVEGVGVRTTQLWDLINDKPSIFVINKLDVENADYEKVFDEIKESFGHGVVPFVLPIGTGDSFEGLVDIVKGKAYKYERNGDGKGDEIDIPADLKDKVEDLRLELMESVAESDDELLEKYFAEGSLTEQEMREGLKKAVLKGEIYPTIVSSAYFNIGTDVILDSISNYLPSPKDYYNVKSQNEEEVKLPEPSQDGKFSALTFKTFVERHLGELSYLKVFSGDLEQGKRVENKDKDENERIGQLFISNGSDRIKEEGVIAGDIVATVKLKHTSTNDVLADKDANVDIQRIDFPDPVINVAVETKGEGDEDKVAKGFSHLSEEDPTCGVEVDSELKQTLLYGQGELHLNLIKKKLKKRFGVEVDLVRPKVPYRETVSQKVEVRKRHKKQSGGRGQYGEVYIRVEPLPTGEGFEFVDDIRGGVVPSKFIPSVEDGIKETMEEGILAGYKVTDVKVTLYDGSHHPVDSSDKAFSVAGSKAFQKAFEQANPYLLEPVYDLEVMVPEDYMGDVVGDISSRRGQVGGMETHGNFSKVKASVPLRELYKYSTSLRSITQGRGVFTRSFSKYKKMPRELQKEIIEKAEKE